MRREDDLLITISVFNSVGVCASITYPAEKEHEKKRKYQAAKDLAKVLPVCDALPPDYTRLRSRALQDHFFRTVEPGRFYSVTSAANMKVVDVKMYHDTPETQPLQTVSLPDVAKTHFAQDCLTFHGIVVWLLGGPGRGHLHAFRTMQNDSLSPWLLPFPSHQYRSCNQDFGESRDLVPVAAACCVLEVGRFCKSLCVDSTVDSRPHASHLVITDERM